MTEVKAENLVGYLHSLAQPGQNDTEGLIEALRQAVDEIVRLEAELAQAKEISEVRKASLAVTQEAIDRLLVAWRKFQGEVLGCGEKV